MHLYQLKIQFLEDSWRWTCYNGEVPPISCLQKCCISFYSWRQKTRYKFKFLL